MHVHSTASELSKLGIQRSLHLPECATHARRGLRARQAPRDGLRDDHRPRHDRRRADARAPARHVHLRGADRLVQGRAAGRARPLLRDHARTTTSGCRPTTTTSRRAPSTCTRSEITAALAHPFYAVEAPLTARHRRRLAQLFPIWETRNGSRAKELNLPAFVYIETHGGTAIGGSDDHAGIDIGRTFTETPRAATPEEFLAHVRAGRAPSRTARRAARPSGRTPRWRWRSARSATATTPGRPDPGAVLKIVERVMSEGDVRQRRRRRRPRARGRAARCCARGSRRWTSTSTSASCSTLLQDGELSHPDLYRRARRIHERELAGGRR